MKFIDQALIEVQSGKGGSGAVHFRREKYIQYGGPDGGNGGNGGSIIIQADPNKNTLLDFKFHPLWRANNGQPGQGNLKDGAAGEDIIIKVPIGTEILSEAEEFICDLTREEQKFILAKGGRGGKGNTFFKSSVNRAPEKAQPGEEGENKKYLLNLKLVADVGLVGFPNAGKSTLISVISAARPKIADYPFTTLTPNLGTVQGEKGNFVVADIPGLIPEASTGKGLGMQFLKHIERTRALVFLLDPLTLDSNGQIIKPYENYLALKKELGEFNTELENRPEIIVISKDDLLNDEERKKIRQDFNTEILFISSATQTGLTELKRAVEAEIF